MDANTARLEVGARSETGYVREENQDRMTGDLGPFGPFYIVADGMGGHKGGALAAQLAVQELTRQIKQATANESVEQVIQAAFKKANETIYQKGHAGDPEVNGMGTTAVLLLISGRVARLAHVGDSRAYLYRDGLLKQLTTDHTMVQRMVEAGMLKPEDAADHPNASILERAIGTHESVEVDIAKEFSLQDGDAILLCSDGLSGYVTNQEIESALRSPSTSQEITTRLVNLALEKGGRDNVTVQFIQYGPRKEPPAIPPNPAKPITATAVGGASSPIARPKPRGDEPTIESTKIDKPPVMSASKSRPYSFHAAVAFVLGAAISASGFYVLRSKEMAGIEGVNKQLEETKNARALAEEEVKSFKETASKSVSKWQKELEEAKTARGLAEKEVKKAEGQLAQVKAEVSKLQNELKRSEAAKKTVETNVTDLKQQLAQSAKAVGKLQEELKKSEAAKKIAETKLNEKDGELQALKNQITSKTPKEPPKPAGAEGVTAPREITGSGAGTGQKETPEAK